MVLSPEQRAELRPVAHNWNNPEWGCQRLAIINDIGRWSNLYPLWQEQQQAARAFQTSRKIYVIKCRQVGMTTLFNALFFWKLYTSTEPRALLQIAHEQLACVRINAMFRTFRDGLPRQLRPPLGANNSQLIEFTHNLSRAQQLMAGGRSQARSNTYTDLHATEVGLWPRGSAASGSEQDTTADTDMWASALAAIHAPDAHIVVESTANGPRGLFYNLFKTARTSQDWAFLFFPWYECYRYSTNFTDDEAKRRFERELDDEESSLLKGYKGITLENLYWRRLKLEMMNGDILRFNREYPTKETDPFMLDEAGWFDLEILNRELNDIPKNLDVEGERERCYFKYEPGETYFMGVDTSGGVGGDDFVIQVIRADFAQCYVYRSNRLPPEKQHIQVSRVGAMYRRPMTVVEANKYGRVVLDNLRAMGDGANIKFYVNPDTGRDFFSTGGQAGAIKRKAFSYARDIIGDGLCTFLHPDTVRQLQGIVEKPSGKIEAAVGHDDLADAFVLALWAGRKYWRSSAKLDSEREQHQRRVELARNPYG